MYKINNSLLIEAGGGGGASGGYHGKDGQAGTDGTSSAGPFKYSRKGGKQGNPGECNKNGGNYHGRVGAGWLDKGCARAGTSHGEGGGSRLQGWVGGLAGRMKSGNYGGHTNFRDGRGLPPFKG